MANNRMFLVHLPTGLAVGLGKRYGWGWHLNNPDSLGSKVEHLYDMLLNEYSYGWKQDDFALALEDDSGATVKMGAWSYAAERREDGLKQLRIKANESDGE